MKNEGDKIEQMRTKQAELEAKRAELEAKKVELEAKKTSVDQELKVLQNTMAKKEKELQHYRTVSELKKADEVFDSERF